MARLPQGALPAFVSCCPYCALPAHLHIFSQCHVILLPLIRNSVHDTLGEHVEESPDCRVLPVVDHIIVQLGHHAGKVPSDRLWHPGKGWYLGDVHLLEARKLCQ